MASEFPRFSNLPKEIQSLIWDAAVRPVPGGKYVQRFMVRDQFHRPAHPQFPISGTPLKLGGRDMPPHSFSLAIPWDDPDGNPNDSVYMLDSSLWTACADSRAAMERRFRKNEWWSGVELQSRAKRLATPGLYFGQPDAAHSATYIGAKGKRNHITITPNQDLLYLDPRHLDSVDWFHYYNGDFMPLVDLRIFANATKPSFLGTNIGLDYDPTMLDTLIGRCVHYSRRDLGMSSMSMVDMVERLHDYAGRTLWFVDHRLRPIDPPVTTDQVMEGTDETPCAEDSVSKSNSNAQCQNREVFRSGTAIFTEVKREDIGISWTIDTDSSEADRGDRSVFEFFDRLFQEANSRLDIQNSDRMRVLACEAAPGETLRPLQPFANNRDAICPICNPKETVIRAGQADWSTITSFGEVDHSLSDWNLFNAI